jgi:hypothetical protein
MLTNQDTPFGSSAPGYSARTFLSARERKILNLGIHNLPELNLPTLPRFIPLPVTPLALLFNLSSPPLSLFPPRHPTTFPPTPYTQSMDPSRKDLLPYTASCNPPRKAKRPTPSGSTFPALDRPVSSLPPLAPAIPSVSSDVTQPADNDPSIADVPQPKRRGRKPSSLSRAARESMRRQNHSRIEKARRTKINDALAMLRDLVPADAGRKLTITLDDDSADDDDDDDDEFNGSRNSKKSGKNKLRQEKEFKLEILEKAVLYVQELQEKVRVLEERDCARCSNVSTSATHRPKRKHEAMPSSDDYDSHSSLDAATDRPTKRLTSSPPSLLPLMPPAPAPSTRLPSISSWLPKSIAEMGLSESHTPSINPIQLPTPPASGVIGPIASPQVPPALRLDLPIASLPSRALPASAQASPSWTPEDESVASLLLRIKTSNSPKTGKQVASVSDLLAPIPEAPSIGCNSRIKGIDDKRVQTPGSLLGMTTEGPK